MKTKKIVPIIIIIAVAVIVAVGLFILLNNSNTLTIRVNGSTSYSFFDSSKKEIEGSKLLIDGNEVYDSVIVSNNIYFTFEEGQIYTNEDGSLSINKASTLKTGEKYKYTLENGILNITSKSIITK